MKYAIFTEEEYVYLFPAWQRTADALRAEHALAGVWLFPTVLKGKRGWRIPWWYARTFGLGVTVHLAWQTILARLRAGVGFSGLAKKESVPLRRAASPNAPEVVAWVREQGIDVVFITLGHIIKPSLLEAVRRAVVNKHSALLPSMRGLMPVFWAMKEKSPVGVTVHEVSSEIDAGRILVQRAYPDESASVAEAYQRIYSDMPELLSSALAVLSGAPPVVVPGERTASYRSLPTPEDVQSFFAAGGRFV